VIALVASAGSSATGAIDPLEELAAFCESEGLWFHVDGAHGASLALSARYRSRLVGIERADSVVWDAHKMMLTPALLTAVIFREGRTSYQAFAQEASYLYACDDPRDAWYDVGMRTLECTKRMMGMVLYGTLALHSASLFEEYLDSRLALSASFAAELARAPDFELATEPDCNIVCFRYLPKKMTAAEADALQTRLRETIVRSGTFYLVQTRLRGILYLRVTLINPHTRLDDLVALLEQCRSCARGLL
jgi:L-2,4-diaminobutyrate decarboxylase